MPWVRLDLSKILVGVNGHYSLMVAEGLRNICGATQTWVEPKNGYRVDQVQEIPHDVPQAGVYWIVVNVPVFDYVPFKFGGINDA